MIFSGPNIYSGVTNITQGVLISDNTEAVSGTATVVENGTALELEASLANEAVYLFGNGIATNGHFTGALRSISGTDTYTGTITLMSNATIGADSGATLIIGNGAGLGTVTDLGLGYTVTKESTGTLIYDDPTTYGATGAGVDGSGVTLPNGLTYGSGTVVSQGILVLEATGALNDDFGDTTPVTSTTVLDGAQVRLQGGVTIDENFNLTGSGYLSTGALYSSSGANTINGNVILAQNASFAPVSTPSPVASIGVDNALGTLTMGRDDQPGFRRSRRDDHLHPGSPLAAHHGLLADWGHHRHPQRRDIHVQRRPDLDPNADLYRHAGRRHIPARLPRAHGNESHHLERQSDHHGEPEVAACLASITASTTVTFGGLNKVGQGTLIFTQNVMATGPGTTTVSAGIVELAATASFGYIVVNTGAAVTISSSTGIDATATVTLNGTGVSDGAAR